MKRRQFITISGGAAVLWPLASGGQQPAKQHRVAFIAGAAPVSELVGADPINPVARAFVQGLRALGYVEGRNLVLEWRSAEGRYERFPEIIREVVSTNVDVIVTVNSVMAQAAKAATQTVPIVMASSSSPVEWGLIQSLARPGGNITGLTTDTSLEIFAKRLQLLNELLPGVSRVAFLWPGRQSQHAEEQAVEAATRTMSIKILLAEHTNTEYAEAFALITRERPDALLVTHGSANLANRHLIVEFAAKARIPAMYPFPQFAKDGGLIAYGVDNDDLMRRAAGYIDRILKGAKPADLPVEQPTKFLLTINLRTAKALGLTVPQSLLARADEVIE